MAGEIITQGEKIVEENAVGAPVSDVVWNPNSISTESETHLEDDEGFGEAAVIRVFEFAANPEAFKQHKPTKQELFNSHYKGIEIMLWKDGLKVMPEVEPKLTINKKKTKYRIIVGATPMRGHILREQPKTLSQIAHNQK